MRVLVVIGPSGAGKSAAVRELHRRSVIRVTPSWTTRPRRPDELTDTVEHRFVSEEEFSSLEHAGFFLEVIQMFGLPYRYGLPAVEASARGGVPAIMVRAPLMSLVARHFPQHVVYQIEDRFERVRERLDRRGITSSERDARLEGYDQELAEGRAVARRIFVNGASVAELVDAVEAALAEDFADARREKACHSGA